NRVLNRIIERDRPAHLVLERLNSRTPGLSRRMNRLLQNCGRAVVRQKLQDLEEKYGVAATVVNAAYSSQECSACGCVDARNRDGERFRCLWCERRIHADVNAARIIGRRRSSFIGSGLVTKAGVLQEAVCRFPERHPRLKQGRSGARGEARRSEADQSILQGLVRFGDVNVANKLCTTSRCSKAIIPTAIYPNGDPTSNHTIMDGCRAHPIA